MNERDRLQAVRMVLTVILLVTAATVLIIAFNAVAPGVLW